MSKLATIITIGFSAFGFTACVSTAVQTIPKTPESYTISGTTLNGTATHFINLVEGKTLEMRLRSNHSDIVFDIFDANSNERIYTGLTSERPNIWLSNKAIVNSYHVKVYDSADDAKASDIAEYTIEIFQSD